jgi:hypothetical protein
MGTLGKMKNPNATVSAQKVAGSNGVGPTKSKKATAQKVAGSKGAGTTKSQKLSGATPSKMKMGGMKKGGMKRGC